MKVEVGFTNRSINEVQQQGFGRFIVLYEIVVELFPLAVIFSLPIAAVVNLIRQAISAAPEWSSAGGLLIASLVPTVWAIWRFRDRKARRNKHITAGFPQTLVFGSSGIETRESGGRVLFAKWSYYSGFRQGESIFLLRVAHKPVYRAIPVDTLSEEAQCQMRALLIGHLPEI